jgi:uncharacterized protein (TIGR02594 family)
MQSAAGAALCAVSDILAKSKVVRLPEGIGVLPDFAGLLPTKTLGAQRPMGPEEQIAKDILAMAPTGLTAYAVARYFLAVGNGKYGDEWVPYVSGWPIKWNPVIVAFFNATNTRPEGDVTPWCAAFVNWCFLRALSMSATKNASSGSFRCSGVAAIPPAEGDVVVFRKIDDSEACAGRGHVGFFVRDLGDSVEVLGGNQIEGHDGCHKICVQRLGKSGSVLQLHSYRTFAMRSSGA